MKTQAFIVLLMLILTGCRQVRIDMISEHSGLRLPEKYKIIRNTTESSGFAGQDFEINVTLEFYKQALSEISEQIDSLVIVDPHWIKKGQVFEYYNEITDGESESIKVDLRKSVLTYYFVHI